MRVDKKNIYIISAITLAVLLVLLFVPGNVRLIAAIILPISAAASCIFIKKRSILSINKGTVSMLMTLISLLYLVLFYLSGLKFDFYKTNYVLNFKLFYESILPIASIIVASEIMRCIMRSQNSKIADVTSYLSCAIAEVLIYTSIDKVSSYNKFMDLLGLYLFPAIIANLVYHYLSKRYGMLPITVYRLITALYMYFIPYIPAMPDPLISLINLFVPILIFVFIDLLFEKKKKKVLKRKGRLAKAASAVLSILLVASMVGVVMLISCQFRFGALVIATESMTGEINKGDMIVYERYDGQIIEEGQVIVFDKENVKIVHRVVKIENVGGEMRYYTKGDANKDLDAGYINDSHIVGLTDVKIAYVGYPTLWLREQIPN